MRGSLSRAMRARTARSALVLELLVFASLASCTPCFDLPSREMPKARSEDARGLLVLAQTGVNFESRCWQNTKMVVVAQTRFKRRGSVLWVVTGRGDVI